YTWAGGGVDTRVTYQVEPEGAGTRLHFEQSGFDLSQPWGTASLQGAEVGWGYMLAKLEGMLAETTV
ncbi:MAG: SRPBCC domain-containing protein, partial [Dehalococcoidia bacterium]